MMRINKNTQKLRPAFTLVEIALVLTIMGVVFVALIQVIQSAKEDTRTMAELTYYESFNTGAEQSFVSIVDAFEPICSVMTDATNRWGWGHASCSTTSPVPTFVATGLIKYNIQWTSLTAPARITLRTGILDSFRGACTLSAVGAADITLLCPNLTNLTNTVPHTLSTPVDPVNPPSFSLSYRRISEIGLANTVENYNFSLNDVYSYRRRYSMKKMNTVARALKRYYDAQILSEIENAPVNPFGGGLHSMDDEFIPWHWKAFGDNVATVMTTRCVRNANAVGICGNIVGNNGFRTGLSGRGLFMNRVITNLLGGQRQFALDGLGNQVNLYPVMSQCAANDISTCATAVPTTPRNDYVTSGGTPPPHSSMLWVEGQNMINVSVPAYARTFISY